MEKAENHNFIPDDLSNYKVVRPGDLAVNKMKAWSGSVGVSSLEGIVSPAYFVYSFISDCDARFANYLFRSPNMRDEFARSSKGVRVGQWDLDPNALKAIRVAIPDVEEQKCIVRYLDHAELRIARAVQMKGDLINRLLEMRQVRIAAGILGGRGQQQLHSSLPYLIPDEWLSAPFWSVAPEVSESGYPDKELLSVYLDRGVIRYSESSGQVHKPSVDLSAYQLVRPHDLVLNNQQAWRGSVGVSRYDGIISPAYVICRLDERLDGEFANLLFRSPAMVNQFVLASRGVGSIQRQLHRPSLRVLRVPIPPMDEQVRIACELSTATRDLDVAVESLRAEIALLKEYRTRLISDVVTGKLDVRAEAEKLGDIDPAELAAVLSGGGEEAELGEEEVDADD